MTDITANVVVSMPSQLFTMARYFKAVANGKIYIGKIDTDPVNPENQIQVYVENEDGSHVPVSQPIIINAAGYPVYNGQIAKFVTVQGHSMAVYDAYGAQQFYFPNVLKYDPDIFQQKLNQIDGVSYLGGGNYTDIRSYNGTNDKIICYGRNNLFDGGDGVFYADPTDTTSEDNDGTILVGFNGRRWKRVYGNEVSPSWFGVTGDGVSDDSDALQNALNIAKINGCLNLTFRSEWLIKITKKIMIYSNTSLHLRGATIIRAFDNSDTGVNTFACIYTSEVECGNNISVFGGVFNNNGNIYKNQASIFEFVFTNGIIFRDCTFLNVSGAHAIDLSRVRNVSIENCRFMGFMDWAGNRRFSDAIQIETPLSSNDNIASIKVSGCYFGPSESLPSWAVGVGNHGSTDGAQPVIDIKIHHCTFDGNSYSGIRGFSRWENVDIGSNTFINFTNPAIIFTGRKVSTTLRETSRDVCIHHNTFKNCTGNSVISCLTPTFIESGLKGSRIFHRDWRISGNNFESCDGTILDMRWVDGVSITGNTVDSCNGIFLRGNYIANVIASNNKVDTTKAIFYIFEDDGEYKGTLLSRNISIVGNTAMNGRRAVHINCECHGFTVTSNSFESITGDAVIGIDSSAKNGVISNNCYHNSISNEFFVDVTASCSNIIVADNVYPPANIVRNLATDVSYSIIAGTGNPEGVQIATPGSEYRDIVNGRLYIKESGRWNSGWVVK